MNDIAWADAIFDQEYERCSESLSEEAMVWLRMKNRAVCGGSDPEFRKAISAIGGRRDRARILDILVAAVLHWNPTKIAERRDAIRRVDELDAEIAEGAAKLSRAIRSRAMIREQHGIGKPMGEFDVPMVFPRLFEKYAEQDQQDSILCRMRLMEELRPLIDRFDYKYWPTLPDLLDIVATAASIEVEFGQMVDDAGTLHAVLESRQASNRDFVRAFFSLLNDSRDIDRDWCELSYPTLAALMSAALGHDEKEITAEDVRKCIKADN